MSQSNPFRVFVTHGWDESDDYLRVFEFLESARGFYYRNTAAPDKRPAGTGEAEREALRAQIAKAEVVIAVASQIARTPDQLLFEMTFAQASRKPVLLLKHFGVKTPLPKNLTDLATQVLDWDERALVDAIRQHARGEVSGRWDMVEFKLD